ncbi:MAG: MFS transporter [Actinobacteria bacterium]|nr:MAG: MFS transporter [Actinomycetota bacterium]
MTTTDTTELQSDAKATKAAWAILAAMGFGALIAQMFSTVIGPALPTIETDLGLSLSVSSLTITAYSLAFGTFLVIGGRMGDLVGEVKMIIIGFVIFGAGLIVAAIAASGPMLVGGRAIQGIGIGVSAPATLSIVVNSFPVKQRGFAVGVWGFAHGFGLLLGPLFAAWMLDVASWRWVFWVAVPLTALVIVVTIFATRGYKSVLAKGKYDYIGAIVGGLGITLLTLGVTNAAVSWTAPSTLGPLIGGLILLAIFGVIETKITYPLVDFGLWRERLFSGGFFAESAVGFVYIPFLVVFGSTFLITVLDYSPSKASWVIVITTGICMVFEPPAGRWVDKVGPGLPITVALVLQAIALAWIGFFVGPDTSLTQLIAPLLIMGIGVGISLPACNTAGMSAVDAEHAGMGSGLMQMTFNIPAALGMAIVTAIIGPMVLSGVKSDISDPALADTAHNYADLLQKGDTTGADDLLASLSSEASAAVKAAAVQAQSSAITTAMIVLAVVALAGAVFAWVVIGRRRTPDHVQMTHAAEV